MLKYAVSVYDAALMRRNCLAIVAIVGMSSLPSLSRAGFYSVSYEQSGTSTQVGPHGGVSNPPYADSGDGGRSGTAISEDYYAPPGGEGAWYIGRSGSADCNAPIKAHFHWYPSFLGEETPHSVIVYKTATASWGGDTGSASDGLGGTYTAWTNGGSSTGAQVEVVNEPSEDFDRTCTPTATGSVNSVYTTPENASAGVYFRAEAYVPYVQLNGTTNGNTCVGLNVQALLMATVSHWGPSGVNTIYKSISFSDFNWEVPGMTYSYFYVSPSADTGHPVYVADGDWQTASPNWRWRNLVQDDSVLVTAHPTLAGITSTDMVIAGQPCNAAMPTYLFNASPGYNRYYKDGAGGIEGTIKGGSSGDMVTYGIFWTAWVTAPSGYTGDACFVQLVHQVKSEMNAFYGPTTPDFYLDSVFPYSTWSANGVTHNNGDGPMDAIGGSYPCDHFDHDWEFETWLMFKPTGGDWVPLKKLTWAWVESFDAVDGVWPDESTLGQTTWSTCVDFHVHPSWEHRATGSPGSPGTTTGSTGSTTGSPGGPGGLGGG